MLWLFVGPAGVNCWVSFATVVQFYLLLGPCLCFVSFLCLGLCCVCVSCLITISMFRGLISHCMYQHNIDDVSDVA